MKSRWKWKPLKKKKQPAITIELPWYKRAELEFLQLQYEVAERSIWGLPLTEEQRATFRNRTTN